MDRDEVEVRKLAKKERRLSGKFCLRDTAGSLKRARWLHLAGSGSQSQRVIWVILPACRATCSHIIKSNIDTIYAKGPFTESSYDL